MVYKINGLAVLDDPASRNELAINEDSRLLLWV
jgi:hypothetical protein